MQIGTETRPIEKASISGTRRMAVCLSSGLSSLPRRRSNWRYSQPLWRSSDAGSLYVCAPTWTHAREGIYRSWIADRTYTYRLEQKDTLLLFLPRLSFSSLRRRSCGFLFSGSTATRGEFVFIRTRKRRGVKKTDRAGVFVLPLPLDVFKSKVRNQLSRVCRPFDRL